jgi:hypothetical protein
MLVVGLMAVVVGLGAGELEGGAVEAEGAVVLGREAVRWGDVHPATTHAANITTRAQRSRTRRHNGLDLRWSSHQFSRSLRKRDREGCDAAIDRG